VERDERRRADALDRYWDAVLRGEAPRRPAEVDDVAAAVIVRLGEPRPAPHLDAAHRRVRRRIIAPAAAPEEPPAAPMTAAAGGHVAAGRPGEPPISARRPWAVVPYAIVTILVLALGLGARALWPGEPARHPSIPAVDAPASPAPAPPLPAVTEETLAEATVPAPVLGSGRAGAALDHVTLPPGTRSTWTAFQNVQLRYVLRGALTVRSAGPIRVWRAGEGAWEAIPAPTEVALGPGDAVLFFGAATAGFANPGPEPAELLGWVLVRGGDGSDPYPPEWVVHDVARSGPAGVSLPLGSAALRLRRVELPPAAVLAAPPAALVQLGLLLPDAGPGTPEAAALEHRDDGGIGNAGAGPATVYVVTLEAESAAAGASAGRR
jgi:hypothetical protein